MNTLTSTQLNNILTTQDHMSYRPTKAKSTSKSLITSSLLRLPRPCNFSLNKLYEELSVNPDHRVHSHMIKFLDIFLKLNNLFTYINYEEPLNKCNENMLEFSMVMQYKNVSPGEIIAKIGDLNNKLFIVLEGTVNVIDIEYSKTLVSDDEYFFHLIKLELLGENYILKKIKILNRDKYNMGDKSLSEYINKYYNNSKIDMYVEMRNKCVSLLIDKFNLSSSSNKISINKVLSSDILKTKKSENISTYINLIQNIEINQNGPIPSSTSISLTPKKAKKNINLPHYYLKKKLTRGDFFNDFTLNPNNKYYYEHTYISGDKSTIGYVNKEEQNRKYPIFDLYTNKIKRLLTQYQKLYIFNYINTDTFINEYYKFFSFRLYKKGDILFRENTEYFGVFILLKGDISISTNKNYSELNDLKMNIKHSFSEFSYFLIKGNNFEYGKTSDKHLQEKNSKIENEYSDPVLVSNEFKVKSKEKAKRNLLSLNKPELFGLCNCYDSKNNLYFLTAECVSEEAEVFFLDKLSFDYISKIDFSVSEQLIELLKLKSNFLINTIEVIMKNIREGVKIEIEKNKSNFAIYNVNCNTQRGVKIKRSNKNFGYVSTNFDDKSINIQNKEAFNTITVNDSQCISNRKKLRPIIRPSININNKHVYNKGCEYEKNDTEPKIFKNNIMFQTLNTIKNTGYKNNRTLYINCKVSQGLHKDNRHNISNISNITNKTNVNSVHSSCNSQSKNYFNFVNTSNNSISKYRSNVKTKIKLLKLEDIYKTNYLNKGNLSQNSNSSENYKLTLLLNNSLNKSKI